MASNADCPRIMRNMERCEAYLGLPKEYIHIHLNYNIIMVNLSDQTHSFSKYQRVDSHCIEFTVISWSVRCCGRPSVRTGVLTATSRNLTS